jgi:lysophospholipase L1-like esterase
MLEFLQVLDINIQEECIVILLGTNNIQYEREPEQIRKLLCYIRTKAPLTPVIWITVPIRPQDCGYEPMTFSNRGDMTDARLEFNTQLREVAAQFPGTYIRNLYKVLTIKAGEQRIPNHNCYYVDGLHFSKLGKKLIMKAIFQILTRELLNTIDYMREYRKKAEYCCPCAYRKCSN